MKKYFLFTLLTLILVSCQITERFYLNESGAVKYENEINFTEMLSFLYDEHTKDSLRQTGDFPLDTIISFAELENFDQLNPGESSQAEIDFMKSMNKTNVHMIINDNEGKMIVRIEENNIEAFNAYLEKVNSAMRKLEKEDPEAAAEMGQSGIMKSIQMKFDGKNFQRIADNPNHLLNEMDDSLAEATRGMMNMFQYKMEYHFPKRIKNSSLENATYSLDGKVMTVDVTMSEMLDNPDKFNFEIELE